MVIAFLVSLAVFIPASGWLGDRFGGRAGPARAIAIFTVASALCGLATSLSELVGFRVLQGVGGGLMTPVGMAMLFRVFPPAERVRAVGILIIPTALAPALGPVIGGLFVTDLSWRWVFYVNVPIGVAALIFGAALPAPTPAGAPGPVRPARVPAVRPRARAAHVRRVRGTHMGWDLAGGPPTGIAGRCCWSRMVIVETAQAASRCSTCGFRPTGCSAQHQSWC